jgi:hypothetical protein
MIRKQPQRRSQRGFIVTIELLFLAAILVIGLIVGMVNVRDSVLAELSDVSESVGNLNQGYDIQGVSNLAGTAATAGSAFQDAPDMAGLALPIDTSSGNADQELTFSSVAPGSSETATP